MKYIDADKIRTEIKRLKAENNCGTDEFIAAKDIAYDKVFDFLEILEEPVTDCHDLEEAAEKYADLNCHNHVENETDWNGLLYAFKAGAEWMKAKMMDDAYEEEVQEVYRDDDGIHCGVSVGTDYKPGTIVYVITIPKEEGER